MGQFALQTSILARGLVRKSDDPPVTAGLIDTGWAGRTYAQELADANRRLRVAKAERRAERLDLGVLAITGGRVTKDDASRASSDVVTDTPQVRVFAFRTMFPAMAANARDESDLVRMATAIWDTLDDREKARFRAAAPDIAMPSNTGGAPQTAGQLQQLSANFTAEAARFNAIAAELLGRGAVTKDDDSVELDTSRQTIDAWASRRAELRKRHAPATEAKTTVAKAEQDPDWLGKFCRANGITAGRKSEKRETIYKSAARFPRALAARDAAARRMAS